MNSYYTIGALLDRVQAIIDGSLVGMQLDLLHPEGMQLLTGLTLLAVILQGYKVWLAGGGFEKLFVQFAWAAVTIGILFWLVDDGFTKVFVDGIDASFSQVANKMVPGAGDGAAWKAGVTVMWTVLQNVGHMMSQLFAGVGWWDTLSVFFKNLGAIIILIFSQLNLLTGMVSYIAIGTMSMIMVKVAILIAPIMIPWAMFNITAFLFVGWLRFFISAALYKVVGAAILYFTSKLLSGVAGLIGPGDTDFVTVTMAALAIAALVAAAVLLILQIPRISQQLVSGQAGEIGFKFSIK